MPAEFWLRKACAQRPVGGSRLSYWAGLRRTSYGRNRGRGARRAPLFVAGEKGRLIARFIRGGARECGRERTFDTW